MAYFCFVVLKLAGKKYPVLGCLVISCMVYAAVLAILFGRNGGDIMMLVYAGLIYIAVLAVSLCALTCIIVRNGLDWLRIAAIPGGCVCVAGLLCHLLGKALTPHLGGVVTLFVVLILSWLLYLFAVIYLRCFGEQELTVVPGGKILRSLGQLLGVF